MNDDEEKWLIDYEDYFEDIMEFDWLIFDFFVWFYFLRSRWCIIDGGICGPYDDDGGPYGDGGNDGGPP